MRKKRKLKKYENIIRDYDKIKSKHLEKLADDLIKQKSIEDQLKNKIINKDFLNLF